MASELHLSRGRSLAVAASRFLPAAAELIAREGAIRSTLKPLLNRSAATLGAPVLEDIDCTLIGAPRTLAEIPTELLATFTAKLAFESEQQIEAWADAQPQSVFQAVCFAGSEVSWARSAMLAERGIGVSFLPASLPPSPLATDAPGVTAGRPDEPIHVWLIAPADDPYTEAIAKGILPNLQTELSRLNRARPRCALHLSTPSARSDAGVRSGLIRPSLVVLLTHGNDDGHPELREGWQAEILEGAVRQGAFVVHLGCYGAGKRAESPFAPLADLLELELSAPQSGDTVAPFCLDLLRLGASGVLAHVGETWSTCFADGSPFAKLLGWLVSGRPAARAVASLHEDANRLHVQAHDALRKNKAEEAAHDWLRSLDLRQFTLIGSPLASLRR
jgi:hypothetical protein